MAMTQSLMAVRPSCFEVLPTQPEMRALAVAPASTPVSTACVGRGERGYVSACAESVHAL